MGGIGKTTIAQVVSERIQMQFEAYSFLANVREVTEKQGLVHGLVHLQKQLLSDILLESNLHIHNTERGASIIKKRLRNIRVLIILDDVDQLKQVESLSGHTWFGPGSRIIVTSRDEHLLRTNGVDEIYRVKALTDDEALQLFSWKAFKKDQVGEDFLELAMNVLEYANGLPLAIEVLGSFLFGRKVEVWSSALDKLKENPDTGIINVLKVSYDALKDTEKRIFLDIACFLKGGNKDRVTRILQSSSGYDPRIDIEVLMEKSLLTLFGIELYMHDLIQELAWEIVRQECREDPAKRSRLWLPRDIIPILENSKGTTKIQGIFLDLPKQGEIQLNGDPFLGMCKLRILKIHNVNFSGDIRYLSSELQLLEWHACPLKSLPSKFQSDKLVQLTMCSSHIEQLWEGNKRWSMLQFINLSDSQYLMRTPNFSEVPNLETLVLEGCTRLFEVHPSIGVLKKLVLLNMGNCKSVESLPPCISLEALRSLTLSGCSKLKRFPEIKGNMESLFELYLDGTAIEELPPSIERLRGLTLLNLGNCKNLLNLPSTVHCLTSLKSLILTSCSELDLIPESLNCVEGLEELDISGTAIRESSSIVYMKNLKYLSFRGCKDPPSKSWHSLFNCWLCTRSHVPTNLLLPASFSSLTSLTSLDLSDWNMMDGVIPNDIGSLLSLKKLNLSGGNFVHLPESISQLSKLEELNLINCRRLKYLPKKLPLSVRHVNADDCISLIDFPNQFKVWTSAVAGVTTISSLISSKDHGCPTSQRKWKHIKTWTPAAFPGCSIVSLIKSDEDKKWKPFDGLVLPNQVLQKDLELFDLTSCALQSCTPQSEIPEFFSHIDDGGNIAIPIFANMKKDRKWMGVALCALFSAKENPVVSPTESDSETSNYFYQCQIRTNRFILAPDHNTDRITYLPTHSHFLCVFYASSWQFPEMLNKSSQISASFNTSNPCMEVQKCGIRLVYEQDVAVFMQTFMQLIRIHDPIPLIPEKECQDIPSDESNLNEVDEAAFESGWFNLVDKTCKWEKLIPASEAASSTLLRHLEGLNHIKRIHRFSVSGSPAWFNLQNRSSLSIELPPNLAKSKKWMGFVLCAAVAVDHQHIVKESYDLFWELKTDKFNINHLISSINTNDKHQLFVMYMPRTEFDEEWLARSSSIICTSVTTDVPGVEVQMCGLRILYEQDLQGFVQTILHCILQESRTPFESCDEQVVEDWIKSVSLQSCKVEAKIKETDISLELVSTQLSSLNREGEFSTPWEVEQFKFITQDYKNMDWSVAQFSCCLPGIETPKWFTNLSMVGSAEIQLPSNLYDDDNWMGVAMCAYIWIHEHPTIILDTPDSEFTHRDLIFVLETDSSRVKFRGFQHTNKDLWLSASNFTWFTYMPRAQFSDSLNQCNLLRANFGSNCSGLELHNCALRLVFKKDLEELIHMLALLSIICKVPTTQ